MGKSGKREVGKKVTVFIKILFKFLELGILFAKALQSQTILLHSFAKLCVLAG